MVKTIKLFAYLSEQVSPEVSLELPEKIDKEIILSAMSHAYPLFKGEIKTCNVAINQQFVINESYLSHDVAEIALIPPVSGG